MTSEILINGKFAFDKLSVLLNDELAGQQLTEHVRLKSIQLKADDAWLYAGMKVTGRHNGMIVAKFKLRTSDTVHDLFIEQLKISLKDPGILAKGANWMLKNVLGEKIESKVQTILTQTLSSMINKLISKYAVMEVDGISVKTDLKDYNFKNIDWNDSHLTCAFYASGVISVEL